MTEDKKKIPFLLWCDLETTGLDPDRGSILEIGLAVTDLAGNDLHYPGSFVLPHAREDVLVQMDDYVLAMHLKSGLLKSVAATHERHSPKGDGWTEPLRDMESWFSRAMQIVRGSVSYKDEVSVALAGSGVHFGRRWMESWEKLHRSDVPSFAMQGRFCKAILSQLTTYRMLDISTFLTAYPGQAAKFYEPKDDIVHRAKDDVMQAIRYYKGWRERISFLSSEEGSST